MSQRRPDYDAYRAAEAKHADSGTMLSPDCRDAKHTACNGTGFDIAREVFADCPCTCHVRTR